MADIKVKLNDEGVIALLKSSEVASACEKQAKRMTRATGVRYVADVYIGRTRVNASALQRKETEK